jgi:hypothetical protein
MENRTTNNIICNSADSHSRLLLSKFTSTWEKRAQVRNYVMPDELMYETEKPDFLEALIPIKNCQAYRALSDIKKNNILSYGWLAYNAKTIAIESKIISPVCYDIIDGHLPGADDNNIRKLIAETLTDESYHILLSHHAMAMTEEIRQIDRSLLHSFDLEKKVIEFERKYTEKWQKILVRLAVAIVSEIFISDYLKCLSSSSTIVTLNRETVKSHRMDEIAHGRIFTELTKLIYIKLSKKQKDFFSSILYFPLQYFASKELSVWNKILHHVCPESADEIMEEVIEQEWFDMSHLDYKNLIMLGEEIGIKDFSQNVANLSGQKKSYQRNH